MKILIHILMIKCKIQYNDKYVILLHTMQNIWIFFSFSQVAHKSDLTNIPHGQKYRKKLQVFGIGKMTRIIRFL